MSETEVLTELLRCAVCQEACAFPVLFGCNNHYFCAACVRRWTSIRSDVDESSNEYVFTVSCPTCRIEIPNGEKPLKPASDPLRNWAHQHVKDVTKIAHCPFCAMPLTPAHRDHVYSCDKWMFRCKRHNCKKFIRYCDITFHNMECGFRCPFEDCCDGESLTLTQQIEHRHEHQKVFMAKKVLMEAMKDLTFPNQYIRERSVAIMEFCVNQLLSIRLAPEDMESLTDTENDQDDMEINEDSFKVMGVPIHHIHNAISKQIEIEEQLATWTMPDESKYALQHRWRKEQDFIPQLTVGEWATTYLYAWNQLPDKYRRRLVEAPYHPPN